MKKKNQTATERPPQQKKQPRGVMAAAKKLNPLGQNKQAPTAIISSYPFFITIPGLGSQSIYQGIFLWGQFWCLQLAEQASFVPAKALNCRCN